MAFVSRPVKTGLTSTYVEEVAAGQTVIKSSEVDADLDAIIAQINGQIDVNNLADDAVETVKIKDAQVTAVKLATDAVETAKIKNVNVTAAKLATNSVETAKIKDLNVTAGKLAAQAILRDLQTASVELNLNVETVETDIVTLPALSVISTGRVILLPSWAIWIYHANVVDREIVIRAYRDAAVVGTWVLNANSSTGDLAPLPNFPVTNGPLAAGNYVYKYTAQTANTDVRVRSLGANTGILIGISV